MLEKIPRAMVLRAMIVVSLIVCSPALLAAVESSSASGGIPTIETKTAAMPHMQGFLPLHWDARNGRLYLEISQLNVDMLYFDSLPYGTGSNDLGLDRGQVSPAKLVRFERIGPKILLVRPNEYFRSSAREPAELLAVRQSFPESILGSFTVVAENTAGGEAGAVLVDATDFFVRDVHGVSEALGKQGSYKLDAARSAIAIDATKVFPKNTEVEAILTFASDAPERGSFVAEAAPDAHALTLREHQSFLELPAPGYSPRHYEVSRPAQHPPPGGHLGLAAEVQAAVYARTVEALLTLAADPKDSVEVRSIVAAKLDEIKRRSDANSPLDAYLIHRIKQFQNDSARFIVAKPIEAPPGMPIGDGEY